MVELSQFLSQKWINENKFYLNKHDIDHKTYCKLVKEGFEHLGLQIPDKLRYSKTESIDFCNWLDYRVTVEPRYYDIKFPSSYVQPVDFFKDLEDYKMLIYIADSDKLDNDLFKPDFLSKVYENKSDLFMPSALMIEYIELSWLAYDDRADCILVHHNQINGDLANCLSNNQRLWLLRYMIRTFVQRVPFERRHHIFVPEANTYRSFLSRKMGHSDMAIYPYTKEVMQKSDFVKVPYSQFKQTCPTACADSDILDYLDKSEVFFWKFEHDNSQALANMCFD